MGMEIEPSWVYESRCFPPSLMLSLTAGHNVTNSIITWLLEAFKHATFPKLMGTLTTIFSWNYNSHLVVNILLESGTVLAQTGARH